MKENLTPLISSALVALIFSASQTIYGAEDFSTGEPKIPSGGIPLEAILDSGDND